MNYKYPFLVSEIFRRGYKKKKIAEKLGVSQRALSNKLRGVSSFTWEQACDLQKNFFPDVPKEQLFAETEVVRPKLGN